MNLPNFLIIGAQKAGTTTLYSLLQKHTQICMSSQKEPGFFIGTYNDPERFQTLIRPDAAHLSQKRNVLSMGCFTLDEYQSLFMSDIEKPLRGEASTSYLSSPYAARRIFELIPNVKLISILRDPVERAFSAYTYQVMRGTEPAKTFTEAINSELSGERDGWLYGWRYLYSGLYADHLRRYFDYFPREQIKILKFETLKSNPFGIYSEICNFLDIEPEKIDVIKKKNATVHHPNFALRSLRASFTSDNFIKRNLRGLFPKKIRKKIKNHVISAVDIFGKRPKKIIDEDRARLAGYYSDHNERLSEVTNFEFSDWISK